MHDDCPRCGLRFERESGYFVGAVVINTVVIFTTFIVMFGAMVLLTWPDVPWTTVLIVTAAANVVIPTLFYPMSKTVWSALDLSWHPLESDEIAEARVRIQTMDA
jgi:hypothetical protein